MSQKSNHGIDKKRAQLLTETEIFINNISHVRAYHVLDKLGGFQNLKQFRTVTMERVKPTKTRQKKKRKKVLEKDFKFGVKNRGFGFAICNSHEIAKDLIYRFNKKTLHGQIIQVSFPHPESCRRTHRDKFFSKYFSIIVKDVFIGCWRSPSEVVSLPLMSKFGEQYYEDGNFHKEIFKYNYNIKIDIVKEEFIINVEEHFRDYKYHEKKIDTVLVNGFCEIRNIKFDVQTARLVVTFANPPRINGVYVIDNDYFCAKGYRRKRDFTDNNMIGKYLVYTFEFDKRNAKNIKFLLDLLRDIHLINVDLLDKKHRNAQYLFIKEYPSLNNEELFLDECSNEVFYLIKCLESHGYIQRFNLTKDFLKSLKEIKEEAQTQFLMDLFDHGEIIFDLNKTLEIWKKDAYSEYDRDRFTLEYQNVMKRINVSPSRIAFRPEEVDIGNRVIRNYKNLEHLFVRVSFVEEGEDEDRVFYSKEVSRRIKEVLRDGIKVGNYHFKLLAFSNSQLRSCSCWMFSPTKEIGLDGIRHWMGDFSVVNNVAKYSARVGHCFSTTKATLRISSDEFVTINDFKTKKSKKNVEYVFTDGCGLIDLEFTKKVAKEIGYEGDEYPSGFQFRFAGYKGVVVAYDFRKMFSSDEYDYPVVMEVKKVLGKDFEHRVDGLKLILRDSQKKFNSKHFVFEVIKPTNKSPCFLNRQVISLLATRGITKDKFLFYQQKMTKDLKRMTQDREFAMKVMRKYSSFNFLSNMIISFLSSGYSLTDPFIFKCLQSLYKYKIQEIREKTKIFVDDGNLLIGVCDETGILKYGEVYIEVDKGRSGKETEVITGKVAIAKNPAFHVGDIRTFKAVKVPQLKGVRNVVVFPIQGPRDHPNECSGSDLDGDTYFVTWAHRLVPKNANFKPMDYTPPLPKKIDYFTKDDLIDFFTDSLKNNQLGRIANAHLVHYSFADVKVGCNNDKCKKLAHLHSVAVDFPKTGVFTTLPRDCIPSKYPTYLEKYHKYSEDSPCVIEFLYQDIMKVANRLDKMEQQRKKNHGFNSNVELFYSESTTKVDEDMLVEGYEEYVEKAGISLKRYNRDMSQLLTNFKIKSETDAYSFFYIKYVNRLKRKFRMIVERLRMLTTKYKDEFLEEFDPLLEKERKRVEEEKKKEVLEKMKKESEEMKKKIEEMRVKKKSSGGNENKITIENRFKKDENINVVKKVPLEVVEKENDEELTKEEEEEDEKKEKKKRKKSELMKKIEKMMERKAASWYYVTFTQKRKKFLSFAYLNYDILSKIKMRKKNEKRVKSKKKGGVVKSKI